MGWYCFKCQKEWLFKENPVCAHCGAKHSFRVHVPADVDAQKTAEEGLGSFSSGSHEVLIPMAPDTGKQRPDKEATPKTRPSARKQATGQRELAEKPGQPLPIRTNVIPAFDFTKPVSPLPSRLRGSAENQARAPPFRRGGTTPSEVSIRTWENRSVKAPPEDPKPESKAVGSLKAYEAAGIPKLPEVPCSPSNTNEWPFSFYDERAFPVGHMREKVFPCKCQVTGCGKPHPTKMHEIAWDFTEVWVPKRSEGNAKTFFCHHCERELHRNGKGSWSSYRHQSEDHGCGEFRDHPEVMYEKYPESREFEEEFARPWYPNQDHLRPFPRYYYNRRWANPEESGNAPYIETDFIVTQGLWALEMDNPPLYGIFDALDAMIARYRWDPKPLS